MNVVLYARTGLGPEDLERQLDILRRSVAPGDTVVGSHADVAPGIGVERPGLKQALEQLVTGANLALCVSSLDRLARSREEWTALEGLLRERGVALQILEEDQEKG